MRFFRRNDAPRRAPHDTIEAPRVEGDVVYDEHGEVLFDPTIAMGTPNHVAPIPERVLPEEALSGEDLSEEDGSLEADIFPEESVASEKPIPLGDFALDDPQDAEDAAVEARVADVPLFDTPASDFADASERFEVDMPAAQPVQDVTPGSASMPTPASRGETPLLHKRVNLSDIRMDMSRITSDIQSGERLYQRAQQRVESLMEFVERAEVDFSLLNRLEPENRRLKARNRVLESENESLGHGARRLELELTEAREDARTAKTGLEATRSRLAAAQSTLTDRDREIARMTEQVEQVALKMERSQTSVEVESRENVLLRQQIGELTARIDEVTSERMELAKIVESLKIDCDDFRAQREQALTEVNELRMSLAAAQKLNGEMKGQMVSLHEEIRGFKTQYEFNVISREDRITNLEARIADMTKQMAIKEDVAKSALADVTQLRKARSAQDLERERLERLIESQQAQLDEAQAQIRRSSSTMAELDQRYNDVAAALSMHQKRLAPIDGATGAPLAPPPPFEGRSDGRQFGSIDIDDDIVSRPGAREEPPLTPENVEDMIMDYKLGLRAKLG